MKRRILWQVFLGILLLLYLLPPIRSFYFDSGLRWQYILFFAFISAYLAIPFCRSLALRLHILDRPNWRKIHDIPTPLLGGLGVYTAFFVSLLVNGVFLPGMKIMLFGGTLIFLLGLWDDLKPIAPLIKFISQIIIALIVIFAGNIKLTLFYSLPWATLLDVPITVLWIVGLTNAMNFFDGIDGLAAGLSIIAATFLGIIAFKTNQPALGWLAVALVGACVGSCPIILELENQPAFFWGIAAALF